MNKYKIIKREKIVKFLEKSSRNDYTSFRKDSLDLPISAYSESIEPYKKGQIIGVLFQSDRQTIDPTIQFEPNETNCGEVLKEDKLEAFNEYNQNTPFHEFFIEEHLFRITDVHRNSLSVDPFSDEAILHEIEYNAIKYCKLNIDFLESNTLFHHLDDVTYTSEYIEKPQNLITWEELGFNKFNTEITDTEYYNETTKKLKRSSNMSSEERKQEDEIFRKRYSLKYDTYDYLYVFNFIEILEKNLKNDTLDRKHFLFQFPLEKYVLFKDSDNCVCRFLKRIKEYYHFINQNRDLLIQKVGQEFIDYQGTYERYMNHFNYLVEVAKKHLPQYLNVKVERRSDPCCLRKPTIIHNLKTIDKKYVYRHIHDNDSYEFRESKKLTTWHGEIISKEVLKLLQPNDYLRVPLFTKSNKTTKKPNQTEGSGIFANNKDQVSLDYYRLLKRLDTYRWLALLSNKYGKIEEPFLVELDSRGATEIPINWLDNKAIDDFYEKNKTNKGYFVTGCAVVDPTSKTFSIEYKYLK